MFLLSPLPQSISINPETLNTLRDAGVGLVAIVCITIVVWRLLGVVDRNTRVLDKLGERTADYQKSSLAEKEKTREWISTAGMSVAEMSRALVDMQVKLGKDIEGTTDAIRGKDGVLEALHRSALQLTGLTNKTQSVVDTAQQIIASLEQVKNAMTNTDLEMKLKIEAIQDLLGRLASTVQTIPSAVATAETNIIAAINTKQPPAPSPPLSDETIASKPQIENGKGKETEHVEPSSD
jgi:methyl-accepting chemotaxis protein